MTSQFTDAESPTAVIYQLAGSASMCWEDVGAAGEFQSEECSSACSSAIAKLRDFGININDYPSDAPEPEPDLMQQLIKLLNRFSCENVSDTPDHILAGYVANSLKAFNEAVRQRDEWYGFKPWPKPLLAAPQ